MQNSSRHRYHIMGRWQFRRRSAWYMRRYQHNTEEVDLTALRIARLQTLTLRRQCAITQPRYSRTNGAWYLCIARLSHRYPQPLAQVIDSAGDAAAAASLEEHSGQVERHPGVYLRANLGLRVSGSLSQQGCIISDAERRPKRHPGTEKPRV